MSAGSDSIIVAAARCVSSSHLSPTIALGLQIGAPPPESGFYSLKFPKWGFVICLAVINSAYRAFRLAQWNNRACRHGSFSHL